MSGELNRRKALLLGGGVVLATAAGVGSASAAGPESAAAANWVRLPIITANIGRRHLDKREAAIRAVRHGVAGERPLVGWQEISEQDHGEEAMIEKHFKEGYRTEFLRHKKAFRVPISVPKPWKIVGSKPKLAHGGIKEITPPRWVTEVVVQHESNPNLQFVLINTHYLFGAYNGATRPDLRDEYDHHHAVHKQRVLHHHREGRLVIWTADTNNPHYAKATGWKAEKQVFPGGIDRINWLPGNGSVRLQLRGTKSIDMDVDNHNARVAIFRIRAA
jgi:hypothetical protein